jgi:hypothetical protein
MFQKSIFKAKKDPQKVPKTIGSLIKFGDYSYYYYPDINLGMS